jgi:FAD synthetase
MLTTVAVVGCFDILHPGHLRLLKEAKKHGDKLVVILACDANILRRTKSLPFFNQHDRKQMLESLRMVDEVVFGAKKGRYGILNRIKPDVFVVGYDQNVVVEELNDFFSRNKRRFKIVRLKKGLNPEKFKSHKLRLQLEGGLNG